MSNRNAIIDGFRVSPAVPPPMTVTALQLGEINFKLDRILELLTADQQVEPHVEASATRKFPLAHLLVTNKDCKVNFVVFRVSSTDLMAGDTQKVRPRVWRTHGACSDRSCAKRP
jgi:hypothetical protein